MSKILKMAIIGCGDIMNGCHLPGYIKMDNVEIIAFCDIIKERAEKSAKEYAKEKGLDTVPAAYEDYKDVIALPGLDAIDICTPNYLHSIIAVAALDAGLNVFCEKPDAVSVSEAEKMKAAAERNNKVLMVMRNNRYRATSAFLKQRIEEGKLGEIYAGRCGWQRRRGGPPHGSWFSNKALSGGGPLIDLGVHMIDLAMWLMGNPKPVSVSGCTYNKFGNDGSYWGPLPEGMESVHDVEDLAMAFVRFENGACLQVEVSWASNVIEDDVFIELRGTKEGAMQNNNTGGKMMVYSHNENGEAVSVEAPAVENEVPQHEANIRHFADVLLNGVEPMFVPEQGLNMVKILEAIYKSAETGDEILL
ncbi:MAG: Gfo/Idh/MocA family oxidoreductase [Clostridia bacterium]|nr:Gfo/Idh/MocA family oxidoreductase [Clostridia bacterium]